MEQEIETTEEIETDEAVNDLADGSEDETGETDTPADEYGEEETEEEQPERKGKGVQSRINELTAARKRAEAERDYYRAMAEKGGQQQAQQKPEPKTERPKQQDFETYAAYEEALVDWKIEERERQTQEKQRAESADAERRELLAKGAEKYEDFETVVTAEDLPLTPLMVEAAQRTDNVADVLYALGKDPTVTREIATLSMTDPVGAAFRIFQMAGQVADGSVQASAQKKTTKAPAPINAPRGGSPPKVNKRPEDMTMAEYKRWRAQKG